MKTNLKLSLLATIVLVVIGGLIIFTKGTERKNDAPIPTGKQDVSVDELSAVTEPAPFDDVDEKLHIEKGLQLDPARIEIVKRLKNVSLCGEIYKSKQVFIDRVDIVQRTAELLKKDPQKEKWFCENLVGRASNLGGKILPGEEIHIMLIGNGRSVRFSLGKGLINLHSGLPHSWELGFGVDISDDDWVVAGTDVVLGSLKK